MTAGILFILDHVLKDQITSPDDGDFVHLVKQTAVTIGINEAVHYATTGTIMLPTIFDHK